MTTRGGRNLIVLGVAVILITFVTTATSLAIYRLSGDIYLDRSRPGYLPDEEEATESTVTNSSYTFSESGTLTYADLTEYLEELQKIDDRLNEFADPYSPSPLSDESLGIPSELKEH